MSDKIVTWQLGKQEFAIYTEDPEVAKILKKLVAGYAAYQGHDGKVFAWHFFLPTNRRTFFERRIAGKFCVDAEPVTASRELLRDNMDTDVVRVEDSPVDTTTVPSPEGTSSSNTSSTVVDVVPTAGENTPAVGN